MRRNRAQRRGLAVDLPSHAGCSTDRTTGCSMKCSTGCTHGLLGRVLDWMHPRTARPNARLDAPIDCSMECAVPDASDACRALVLSLRELPMTNGHSPSSTDYRPSCAAATLKPGKRAEAWGNAVGSVWTIRRMGACPCGDPVEYLGRTRGNHPRVPTCVTKQAAPARRQHFKCLGPRRLTRPFRGNS